MCLYVGHGGRQREIDFKEPSHVIMEARTSEICRAGGPTGGLARVAVNLESKGSLEEEGLLPLGTPVFSLCCCSVS